MDDGKQARVGKGGQVIGAVSPPSYLFSILFSQVNNGRNENNLLKLGKIGHRSVSREARR